MRKTILSLICVLGATGFISTGYAGWQDWAKDADNLLKSTTGNSATSAMSSSLSNDQIANGLKEALDSGVKSAIDLLGKENGFLNDKAVKIPMPDQLQQVEKVMRSMGQTEMADEFVTSMNRAAEKAVPEVSSIFVDAISKMSLTDAKGILEGSPTAATDYFKKNTSSDLEKLIKPHVNSAMDQAQVTQYYKSMVSTAKKYDTFGLMDSLMGNATDLDSYVTDKTMDGLFSKIALQEKLIRENPAARSTELLKDVFGSLK